MKKRVVSICLSLAMLLALTVPLSAFAAEAGEVPEELPIGTEPAETSDPLTPELSQLPEPDAEPDMSAPQAQPEMQMPPETEEPEAELPEEVPSVAEPPAEETPAVFAEEQEQEAQIITGVESAYKVTYGATAFKLKPNTSGDGTFTFVSNHPDVVKVGKTSGKLTFLKAGKANITVTASETERCETAHFTTTVTVARAAQTISGVKSQYKRTYAPDATFRLKATTSGDGAVTYQSNNPDVVKVGKSSGKATVTGGGTATITITAPKTDRYKKKVRQVTVTITRAKQKIRGVADQYEKSYKKNGTFQLRGTTSGDGKVTYQSSDTSVATVGKTSGKVTMKKRGSCTITVTAAKTANYYQVSRSVSLLVYQPARKLKSSSYYKKSVYYRRLHALKMTGSPRRNVLSIARSQLGYHEGNKASQMGGGNKTAPATSRSMATTTVSREPGAPCLSTGAPGRTAPPPR